MIYEFQGQLYPEYLRNGNAAQHVLSTAQHFCRGEGLDVGAGKWPLPGAVPVDITTGGDAMALPAGAFSFIFSSHCLEHLADWIGALEHWKTRLVEGGVLFLNLPHPDMTYWRPEHCRKHRHLFWPRDVARAVEALGFRDVIHSERDLSWSFQVVGFKR